MTILVVDDDPTMLMALKDILHNIGHDVQTAYDGEQALEKLQQMPTCPDVIISDVMMPVMTGKELWQQLQLNDNWKAIPVVFIAGSADVKPYPDAHFLTKPFKINALLDVIQLVTRSDASVDTE